jgi:hypothetical protein
MLLRIEKFPLVLLITCTEIENNHDLNILNTISFKDESSDSRGERIELKWKQNEVDMTGSWALTLQWKIQIRSK